MSGANRAIGSFTASRYRGTASLPAQVRSGLQSLLFMLDWAVGRRCCGYIYNVVPRGKTRSKDDA
jgi:hypothetical protein